LFAKIAARDPTVFPAREVLRIATIEGVQKVGLGDEVGSLEPGRQADLWRWRPKNRRHRLDMTELNLSPVLEAPEGNIVPNLVYAGSGHEVKTVMVAGKVLVRDGEMLVVDEAAVRAAAQVQAQEVAWRVAFDPVHKETALLRPMAEGLL
jgi:5-methylthioadenosine/S-adenosylhomocysteine deaminase